VVAVAHVRPAEPADVAEIARIQRETWRIAYADLLSTETLAALDDPAVEKAWEQTLHAGPTRLWIATESAWTVGFCAAGPAPVGELADASNELPDDAATTAMIGTLLVEPRWARRGHGGRLLTTAMAALRDTGTTRGIAWIPETDVASTAFYRKAGWQPDGTARTLDADGRPLREIRVTDSDQTTG
jgi:GNAT superfamily N-acetyltransferase